MAALLWKSYTVGLREEYLPYGWCSATFVASPPQGRKGRYSGLGFRLLFGAEGDGLAVSKPRSKPIPATVSN